ncbi:hypothetical protein [Dolichospermum phage Dfl-JY45]
MHSASLAPLLGLRPLDRVLLRPREHEVRRGYTSGWCFFRRSLPCGKIEIASPTGITYSVDPLQVEDVELRVPVQVRGLSEHAWLHVPAQKVAAEHYTLYDVLGATVMRNSFRFEIHDPNTAVAFTLADRAIIHPESWRDLMALARRDLMPVRQLFGHRGVGAIGGGSAVRERRGMAKAAARELRRGLAGKSMNTSLGYDRKAACSS